MRQNTATRVPIRLVDGSGNPVTGVGAAGFLSGIITILKSDGTLTDVPVDDSGAGQNWYELNTTKAPGLYQFTLSTGNTNTLGYIAWSYQPAGGQVWKGGVGVGEVLDGWSTAVPASDGAQVAGSYGALMRLLKQVLSGRKKVDATLGTLVIYKEDASTALQTQSLKDVNGAAAGLTAVETLAGG